MANLPRMSTPLRFVRVSMIAAVLFFPGFVVSCGSSPAPGALGGPAPGAPDDHCSMNDAMTKQPVGVCVPEGGGDAGADEDGGAPEEAYPDPLFNSDGYDDDCKYHVSYTSTEIRRNADVTFTVTITSLSPAAPATGAEPYEEITLNDTHVSPSEPTAVETPAGSGIYKIGPVKFDRAGQWVVRFHMFGDCSDTPEDSPHAHVAFRIDVP
jgi:hypothetical protein